METNKDKVKKLQNFIVASKIARGDSYFLDPAVTVYYTRSDDELRRMYEDDRRHGNTMRDDGESRIHSRQGSVFLVPATAVVITRLNGAEWHGYNNKPRGLLVATIITGPYIGRTVAVERRWLKTKILPLPSPSGYDVQSRA